MQQLSFIGEVQPSDSAELAKKHQKSKKQASQPKRIASVVTQKIEVQPKAGETAEGEQVMIPSSFQFAVNQHGRDKDWNPKILSSRFEDVEGTIDDAIAHIQQGHAICAGLLNGKWRSKTNFTGSHWVLAEVDNAALQRDEAGKVVKGEDGKGIKIYQHQLSIEEALAHPFIRANCSLIYTTPSHRPDWHRFRLVFRLPSLVKDIDHYEAIVRFLLKQIPHDPACKDGVRVFYGNSGAEFPLVNRSAHLPQEWIDQAAIQAEQEKQERIEREQLRSLKREEFQRRAETEGWDTDQLIGQALNCIPPRTIGGGNYQECIHVAKALHSYYGSDAESIIEQWSPSIKGSTWNVPQKIRSFKRSGIGIGTLFYIAKSYGFQFPRKSRPTAVFNDFQSEPDPHYLEQIQEQEREQERIEAAQAAERRQAQLERYRAEVEKIQAELAGLRVKPTIEAKGQFIQPGMITLPPQPGLILTDAGMGSRKTSVVLLELRNAHNERFGEDVTQIAFTPRNTLGRQSGRVLSLPHREEQNGSYINRGTLCFESIHLIDLDKLSPHPIIFLDEASQSISQALAGNTSKDYHAFMVNRIRQLFKRVGDLDGHIVLSEDGLTNLELDFVREASGLEVVSHLKFERDRGMVAILTKCHYEALNSSLNKHFSHYYTFVVC